MSLFPSREERTRTRTYLTKHRLYDAAGRRDVIASNGLPLNGVDEVARMCGSEELPSARTANGAAVSTPMRISGILTTQRLGGQTVFANRAIDALGRAEGQPGGMPPVPRNRF